jgi:hypothetical protein
VEQLVGGRFAIEREAGAGAMARVYRAPLEARLDRGALDPEQAVTVARESRVHSTLAAV